MTLTIVFVLATGYFLWRSFHGYYYSYLPKASEIEHDISAIKDYYKDPYYNDVGEQKIANLIDEDIYNLLKRNYTICIDENIESNERKNDLLLKTSNSLTYTLLLLFISSIPFYLKANSTQKIHKVEVVQSIEEKNEMSDEQDNASDSREPEATPPPKPEPTPIRSIKEGSFGEIRPRDIHPGSPPTESEDAGSGDKE